MKILLYLAIVLPVISRISADSPPSQASPTQGGCVCEWTSWLNNDDFDPFVGDNNSYVNLRRHHDICERPQDIECRSKMNPLLPFFFVERHGIKCDVNNGLVCVTRDVSLRYCEDYEIRVVCCKCPQTTTTPETYINMTSLPQLFNTTMNGSMTSNTTISDLDPIHFLVPISIIIVSAIAFVIVILVVLCVVLSHKDKKTTEPSHDYMEGHSYLQRPVSFTDVDLPRRPSSLFTSSSSSGDSHHGYHLTRLDQGRLQFLQTDEPDVISSNRATEPLINRATEPLSNRAADPLINRAAEPLSNRAADPLSNRAAEPLSNRAADPLINQVPEERQWLPDETAINLAAQNLKQTKKTMFARPVSPNSPSGKSLSFVEENN